MLTNMPRPVDNSVDNFVTYTLHKTLFWLDKCLGYVIEYKHTERKKKQMTELNKVTGHCVVCEGNLYKNEKACESCQIQYGITK